MMTVEPGSLRAEISRLRAEGYGPQAIARSLNSRGISTPSGRGQWWASTVVQHSEPEQWARYLRAWRRGRT